jgi:hypothetical protein
MRRTVGTLLQANKRSCGASKAINTPLSVRFEDILIESEETIGNRRRESILSTEVKNKYVPSAMELSTSVNHHRNITGKYNLSLGSGAISH